MPVIIYYEYLCPPLIVIHTLQVTRHTRREAGIQCQGWQSQIRPCSLDSGTNLFGTDLHLPEGRQAG